MAGFFLVLCRVFRQRAGTQCRALGTLADGLLQVFVDLGEEALRCVPFLVRADQDRQILGHVPGFDGLHTNALKRVREVDQRLVIVQLAAMGQAPRPGKYGRNRIGAGFLALLMEPAGKRAPLEGK